MRKASWAKASRTCASVPGHSWLRCGIVTRFATERWQRPSAVSGAGETVAALAAHIAEAERALGNDAETSWPPRGSEGSRVSPSSPNQRSSGRSCGSNSPCTSPGPQIGARLFQPLQRRRARMRDAARISCRRKIAKAQPAIIVARADRPSKLISVQIAICRHAPRSFCTRWCKLRIHKARTTALRDGNQPASGSTSTVPPSETIFRNSSDAACRSSSLA